MIFGLPEKRRSACCAKSTLCSRRSFIPGDVLLADDLDLIAFSFSGCEVKTRLFAALGAMTRENISEFTVDLKTHLAAVAATFVNVGHDYFLASKKRKTPELIFAA